MRIEILVDNEEPKIYSLDRPKIVVGSHESCDIVIGHKGVSRKHIAITTRDDKFYVADQGSTNGSFINESRLVPGNTTEFSSFFPVRLGDNVLITLLSDEEAQDLGPDSELNSAAASLGSQPVRDESTKMISLKDLNKSSTASLVKKRTETVTKRKTERKAPPPPKKEAASNTLVATIGFVLIAIAGYYQFFIKKKEVKADAVQVKVVEAPKVVDTTPIKRVEEANLPDATRILSLAKEPKCATDFEKPICNQLPLIYQEKWGTMVVDANLVIYANALKYGLQAKTFLKAPLPLDQGGIQPEWDAYQLDVGMISLMLWMKENIPLDAKPIDIPDKNLVIAFVDIDSETPSLHTGAVFVPESFFRLRKMIEDKHFENAKKNGAAEFSYAVEYLRFL